MLVTGRRYTADGWVDWTHHCSAEEAQAIRDAAQERGETLALEADRYFGKSESFPPAIGDCYVEAVV